MAMKPAIPPVQFVKNTGHASNFPLPTKYALKTITVSPGTGGTTFSKKALSNKMQYVQIGFIPDNSASKDSK